MKNLQIKTLTYDLYLLISIKESSEFGITYIKQRARRAYITTICQPEAIFDLSVVIYIFINRSFANNKDLSSQIRFVLVIGSETEGSTGFTLFSNIIYISSIKLARVNILIFLVTTTNIVIDKLGFLRLPTVVYTDSLSLYKCIIKLGIIKEKRLIIDIILIEIRWISRDHNFTNTIIKVTSNKAL
ncbi:hypothetical protein DL98DRAFT_553981 [Cadophora sp. DSE1049]|nr:hypothetical protein DL98DRAFT_553981 [Cadophora sp. DSE1049]